MNNLRTLRGTKSQQQIANSLGITQRTYSNYENGSRYPDYDTLILLANYFDVSLDYMLGREFKGAEAPQGQSLNNNEKQLLEYFRGCNPGMQGQILGYAEAIYTSAKKTSYAKNNA